MSISRSIVVDGIEYVPAVPRSINTRATIGQRLAEIRERKGVSQTALSKRCMVSKTTISNYELDLQVPRIPTLLDLLSGLDAADSEIIYILKGTRS